MSSPTQRSMDLLRERGVFVDKTEHWNAFARRRQDLFGIIDVLGIAPDGTTIAVQTTSASNVSSRIRKIADAPVTVLLRKAGWKIVVHGWRKVKGRWQVREVDCS